jgi:putative peptide zinc metalloprotease protein
MIGENHIYTLSSDIEFSKFNDKEYLLHNSKLNKYTKINEKYYHLLTLADGNRSVSEIKKNFQKIDKTPLSDSQIILLFDKLKKYGVFGYDDLIEEQIKIPNYIKFGFIFLKSEIVSKIVPFLKFLFKKQIYILIFILCFILFGVNLYINYNSYSEFNIITILPYFLLLTFISIVFHELGHATASHHYKAKHGGIGFGLYLYFMPVFFADVTDIWRLDKWKRIVVNSAGVYFEIIFCLVLSIIGFATKNQIIEILSLIIAGKALYNLLPFLRADGYWILSDLFNKPNLNFHSMNNLKLIANSFFKKKALNLKREDYFIAFYGLFNILLIGAFFYYQIFLNRDSIISFPVTILNIVNSIYHGEFSMSFNELIKYLSVLIFYIILVKIILGLGKKLLKSFFQSP